MGQFERVSGPAMDPRAAVHQGGEEGVTLALEHLLGAARAAAPKDEHTLERSGATAQRGLEGVVAFDTPYAKRQHEELDWHHPRGGQAKYLEQPMGTESPTMRALIAQAIRRKMGG